MRRPRIKTLRRRLWSAYRSWQSDDGSLLAASVSYYALFSLFPLLLILVSILGFVLRFSEQAESARQELLSLLAENASPHLAQQVGEILTQVSNKAAIGGPIGVVMLLLGGVAIFTQFDKAFDRIWNVPEPDPGILAAIKRALRQRLVAFLMLAGLGLLMVAVFAAGMVTSMVRPIAGRFPGGGIAWSLVQISLSMALNWGLFTVIYKALPKVKVRWSEAARGGLVAAVLWEAARQLLALLLAGSRYSAYGVIGSLIILMLWIYVAVSVLFLGAEYVQVVCRDCDPQQADRA